MSQERDQFELVYGEAFQSGLGTDFDPTDPGYAQYVEEFIATRKPTQELPFYSRYEVNALRHPFKEAWVEDDLREMARISYFGRKLIDCAADSLSNNEHWRATRATASFDNRVAHFMQFARWVENHEDAPDPDRSKDPDVASPLKLVNWPAGEYVNCLGQSIALAAAAEMDGTEYVYANELVTSDDYLYELHRTVMQEIKKIAPELMEHDAILRMFFKHINFLSAMNSKNRGDKYDDILFTDEVVHVDHENVRDLHHFILGKEAADGDRYVSYRQIDPYGLTAAFVYADENGLIEDVADRTEDVAIIDTYKYLHDVERSLHQALKRVKTLIARNAKLGKNVLVEDMIEGSVEACAHIFTNYIDDGGEDADEMRETYLRALRHRTTDAIEATRIEAATNEETAYRVNNLRYYQVKAASGEFADFHDRAIDAVRSFEKKNRLSGIAARILADHAPLLIFMQVYSHMLEHVWNIKDWGTSHPAIEVANPEFMIGAMYLNHYANYRKDGRINVARYLVRYSASQLIWQAAQLDGESTEDPSMEAVGELVAQLPARQQHPRVALTLQ